MEKVKSIEVKDEPASTKLIENRFDYNPKNA
jgi:hypothetical protein